MPSLWIVKSIGIIIISFIIGMIYYYIISPLSKDMKKKQLEETVSLLINFVIYIWLGKIILNLTSFISDPLAILAYPSNPAAFYVATLLLLINILYKVWKSQFDVTQLLISFVPLFLAASFSYEFIQFMQKENTYGLGYIILLTVLLIVHMSLQDRVTAERLSSTLLTAWAGGQLLIALILPYATMFGYTLAIWFIFTLFLLFLGVTIYYYRKQVS